MSLSQEKKKREKNPRMSLYYFISIGYSLFMLVEQLENILCQLNLGWVDYIFLQPYVHVYMCMEMPKAHTLCNSSTRLPAFWLIKIQEPGLIYDDSELR